MIDEEKIEAAADEYAMKQGDVAPFVKRGFLEGVTWTMREIVKLLNKIQNDRRKEDRRGCYKAHIF